MGLQVKHSLIEAGFGFFFAAVLAIGGYLSFDIDERGLVVALVAALAPAGKRVHEGWKDSIRASEGTVLERDVGN